MKEKRNMILIILGEIIVLFLISYFLHSLGYYRGISDISSNGSSYMLTFSALVPYGLLAVVKDQKDISQMEFVTILLAAVFPAFVAMAIETLWGIGGFSGIVLAILIWGNNLGAVLCYHVRRYVSEFKGWENFARIAGLLVLLALCGTVNSYFGTFWILRVISEYLISLYYYLIMKRKKLRFVMDT